MGKLVAAFVFFLGASALAIHESKPPPPPREDPIVARAEPAAIDHTPPSRAVHDATPPWVKYAAPTPAPPPPVITRTIEVKPRVFVTESEIDIVDIVDKCPDQPNGRDDEDGCPEPVNQIEDRIILVE